MPVLPYTFNRDFQIRIQERGQMLCANSRKVLFAVLSCLSGMHAFGFNPPASPSGIIEMDTWSISFDTLALHLYYGHARLRVI